MACGFPTRSDTNLVVRQRLESSDLGSIYIGKSKGLISCLVTVHLICTFVFAYSKSRFSLDGSNCSLIKRVKMCSLGTIKFSGWTVLHI